MTHSSNVESAGSVPEAEDLLWDKVEPDLGALKTIIETHFNSSCNSQEPMNHGAYARAFRYSLQNGSQLVARVILPVRETIKTESEIAVMDMARARTSIPIPKVHLYCSTPHNPVRAEWVLMDFVEGSRLLDCFTKFNYEQKTKTATDLALIVTELFNLTSSYCGSMLRDLSLNEDQRSPRYTVVDPDSSSTSAKTHTELTDKQYIIGPVNDITFLDLDNSVPAASCGPFRSERDFLEAFAYLGSPGTRSSEKMARWAFEKLFEVYDAVRPLYPIPASDMKEFYFSHGDLSAANVILNPETGAVAGVIDWEMAGFRPAWLSAAGPPWFDDDSCRFVMEDHQNGPDGYGEDTEGDTKLREYYYSELRARNPAYFQHYREGVELRAIFYNICQPLTGNVTVWLEKYQKFQWDKNTRGPFPFDLMGWIQEQIALFRQLHFQRKNGSTLAS